MPRTARKKSKSGIYHIILRGINKQTIFYDDEDREVFLSRLKLVKETKPYEIYSFCLMGNHIHLLIAEKENGIGTIFQKVLGSYVFWYNRKYERIGNLFQDRFKSEPINDDAHLLCAVRYIHQNPLKAGLVKSIDDYTWSSHGAYINNAKSFIQINVIISMLGGKEQYLKFMEQTEDTKFLEFENIPSISDEKLLLRVKELCKKHKVRNLLTAEKEERDAILSKIRKIPGASIRQISRLTGISVSIVRYIE